MKRLTILFMFIMVSKSSAFEISHDPVHKFTKTFSDQENWGKAPLSNCDHYVTAEPIKCDNSLLDKLSSVINCSRIPGINSCAPFAGLFSGGLLGLNIWALYRNELQFELGVKAKNLVPSIASLLHDEWRSPREISIKDYQNDLDNEESKLRGKSNLSRDEINRIEEIKEEKKSLIESQKKGNKKFFQPRLKVVNGKTFDIANLAFHELPEKFRIENYKSAQVAMGEILKRTYELQPIDKKMIEEASERIHIEWLKRNGDWATPEQKLPFNQLSKVEADKDRVIVLKAIKHVKEDIIRTSGSLNYFVGKAARKGAGKFVAGVAGAVAVPLTVAVEALSSKKTGCSEYADHMLDLDENCKPIYSLSPKVIDFLTSDPEYRNSFLNEPKVCNYYKTLLDDYTSVPRIKSASCQEQKLLVSIKGRKEFDLTVELADEGKIKSIKSSNKPPLSTFVFDENENLISIGVPQGRAGVRKIEYSGEFLSTYNEDTRGFSREFARLKPVLPIIAKCCLEENTSKCLKEVSLAVNSR